MAVDIETTTLEDLRGWAGTPTHPRPMPVILTNTRGTGLLSGSFPLSLVTQGGNLPSQADIRILYRPEQGAVGDGVVVATTTCNADGTWQVSGLNENLKFDIVARIPGYNDVIISNVQPMGAPLSAHFANLESEYDGRDAVTIQVVALGGTPPYNFDAIALPAGLTIDATTGYISGTFTEGGEQMFSVMVTDAKGAKVIVSGTSETPPLFQKGMLAMAYACNVTHRQKFNPKATVEPTYEDYFKYALEAFDKKGIDPPIKYLMSSGTAEVAVDTTIVPFFDERWVMVLGLSNATLSGDRQEGTYEFLDANGDVVVVLQTYYVTTYTSGIRYGYDLRSLIVAPRVSYGLGEGYVTLRNGLLKYEPVNPTASSRHDPFSLPCDTASIVGLRVKLSAKSTYTSANGGAAYTYLRVLPEEEWNVVD